ncbi:KEOPS complex Pcc1-like subunit [Halogeometricum borinquense]|uniref:KEOPS complex Pcc1-like subunit n=1 Tax=Halogeometricum borinquense TaxID=60847 RepID=A0A6C0UFG3_9EURY|nr:KEOPS complex subunit Pcc1 [Halogeometricum borinquense]QIB73293.1 KEOPS complex Pcc1-like subunit [Halogeometricum borinquense]QIQ77309.1 KEOPS complex Pcc1-like subunit [Halogeometricum borinquense]
MDSRHDITLTFSYADERRARTVAESIRIEEGEIADDRSTVTVERDDQTVRVRVAAADLVALRAGVNTWTRFVAVAERIADRAA